ncbi:DUF4280 domain-containing protein [Clostridium frigidicarnis]|uniref:DUF4280 domain-containing protein n=1 Tax=Clostridium frigidicarnis TaxID=84698 RepID=A0A1I0VUF7_9CLOT|nr:DUF4280 domain-containing protein [Clostridium frigidicarnis]SFA80045.1 protein of unknown function [Clostridium frigidicarnis]
MAEDEKYVVRGAKMKCKFGSHKRKINLPTSHGSYVNGQPMMNKEDRVEEDNITYFGICSGNCPSSETIFLIKEEDGSTVTGKKCCPKILDDWIKTKDKTKVEGKSALTTKSELVCAYGGLITFDDDGQKEE